MSQVTPWTLMNKGFLAFTCTLIDISDDFQEQVLPPVTCWNIRIDFIIGILFLFPFIYQFRIYYLYYGKQLFKTRQRIILFCMLVIILFAISYSALNMAGLYSIAMFLLQALYCTLLGYFIIKVSKLTSNRVIIMMHVLNILILVAFGVYLGMSLFSPKSKNTAACPGFLDKEFSIFKSVLFFALMILYVFCGGYLSRLLRRGSETMMDAAEHAKREKEIFKLKVMIVFVVLSELAQLVFILYHYGYYSDPSKSCPIDELDNGNVGDNIFVFFYRIVTIYLPIGMILWAIWISRSEADIVFSDRLSEEGFNHISRFASRLSYNAKKQTMPGKSTVTNLGITLNELQSDDD